MAKHAFPAADLRDWNALRDVLAIHESGSLSEAARCSAVSQSTMSRWLAAVESGGHSVFRRDGGGRLSPTERGAAMIAAARQMRDVYEALAESAALAGYRRLTQHGGTGGDAVVEPARAA